MAEIDCGRDGSSWKKPAPLETTSENPKGILEKLLAEQPEKNVVNVAIERLNDEEEIRAFYEQYVQWLEKQGTQNPMDVARANVGFMLGHYEAEKDEFWRQALGFKAFGQNETDSENPKGI